MDQALLLVHEQLIAHEPLHIYSYPVAFRIQLWRSGWDLRTQAAIWERRHGNLRHVDQRKQLCSLLWQLIEKHPPLFLVGPARKKLPTSISHALREFERWEMFYVGGSLHDRFNWRATLQNRAKIRDLNNGLWIERLISEGSHA
jgi:hypothetical protein